MGKYSLDAFEQYPLVKLRPAMAPSGESCFRIVELDQSRLEPEPGTLLSPEAVNGPGTVLVLKLREGADLSDACGFVRRIGFCWDGGRDLDGVLVASGGFSGWKLRELVKAYRQGFSDTFLLAEPGTETLEACRSVQVPFGLWLPLERGVLPLRRDIARENLARNWETYPVYAYVGGAWTEEALDAARRWHCSGAEVPAVLGPRMTLRRLMFPRDLTAGGIMPLRMWWQNLGTAPMYRIGEICLELRKDGERFPVLLPDAAIRPGMGDTTFNANAQLPDVTGSFTLWCGLRSCGTMLPLSMEGRQEDGMYEIGRVTLDRVPRPYLAKLWEETYADGYYPLEDPAQPE